MRKINVVLFSSGYSEQNGILNKVISGLERKGYNVFCWRNLFQNAHKIDQIALLPILIKKIPTFDFAIIIGEGHDKTEMLREGKYTATNAMRDNVIFEIGLCVMALGLSKVILLSDEAARLPDDLMGINGAIAIKNIIWDSEKKVLETIDKHIQKHKNDYFISDNILDEIDDYVNKNRKIISPVVIGAATSTAIGYITNFIIRLLSCIGDGFITENKLLSFDFKNIYMHIIIPEKYDDNIKENAERQLKYLKTGILKNAKSRELSFFYKVENNELHIYDYPTSLVTSYDTAKMILDIEADEDNDDKSKERFYDKELDLFEATLDNIINDEFIKNKVLEFYNTLPKELIEKKINDVCYVLNKNFSIERRNY